MDHDTNEHQAGRDFVLILLLATILLVGIAVASGGDVALSESLSAELGE